MIQRRPLDAVAGVEHEQHADRGLVDGDAVNLLQDAVVAQLEVLDLQPGDGASALGDERVHPHDVDAAAKALRRSGAAGNGYQEEEEECASV